MIVGEWWQDLGGLATLITAIGGATAAVRASKTAEATRQRVRKEMTPNHGSSLRDAVDRIERKVDQHTEIIHLIDDKVDSVGHQIGEVKSDERAAHERIDREIAHLRDRVK